MQTQLFNFNDFNRNVFACFRNGSEYFAK